MAKLTKSQRSELINDVHNFGIDFEGREIFVGGNDIDEINHVLSSIFIINLRLLDRTEGNILIHLNTNGGDYCYGMSMYDTIKSCQNNIITLSYAQSCSMSSIIPQAADLRIIMPNTYFMIHEGQLVLDGTSKTIKSFIEFNKQLSASALDIYTERCIVGEKFKNWKSDRIKSFIKKQMNNFEEWYLTSRQSVEYGFMDAILGDSNYESISKIKEWKKE
jgi:ATP-dependent protease ClpP protease subunit